MSDQDENDDCTEITFPDDLKHLRIEGIAAIEVMLTAHKDGNYRLALEQAREYARIIKRVAEKTEEIVEEVIEGVPA